MSKKSQPIFEFKTKNEKSLQESNMLKSWWQWHQWDSKVTQKRKYAPTWIH